MSVSSSKGNRGSFIWSHNGDRVEMKYDGDVEFTDDDTDLKRLSPNGVMRLSDGKWFGGNSVEFRADAQGNITRRYWQGSSEKPFEPAGREWVARTLPRVIRQTGLGAPARVARILAASGHAGVLAEISLIEGGWGKRIYFTELLKGPSLDAQTVTRILEQAGREMKSDFELASLLIAGADKLLVNDATRKAYFDAARSIESDFEMRRVYSSALKKGPVSPALMAGILDAVRSIGSDFEAASFLLEVVKRGSIEGANRAPFFRAVDSVGSSFERGRVLRAVLARPDASPETVIAVLRSAGGMGGFETSQVLLTAASRHPITGEARDVYVDTAQKLGEHEQGRVLSALVKSERK